MTPRVPDELLRLRELFRRGDPTPPHAVRAAYAAADVVHRDGTAGVEPLRLIGDSAEAPSPVGVRAGHVEPRTLTFAIPGRLVEVDLVPTTPERFRARGIIVSRAGRAAPAGMVTLRFPGGTSSGEIDPAGGFSAEDVPEGPVSLVLTTGRGVRAASDWLVC